MKKLILLLTIFCMSKVILDAQIKSDSTYKPEIIILKSLSIENGKIKFTSETGGCTDKSSFRTSVSKENSEKQKFPHYILTIKRIKPDYCKAFLSDGVNIEFDLEKDCGITGSSTITVLNPVMSK